MSSDSPCPDCTASGVGSITRRRFVQTVGATAAAASLPVSALAAGGSSSSTSETLVTELFESLSPAQKEKVCFAWDHLDDGDPLRMHVGANWHITDPVILSDFYTKDQQELIEAIYFGLYHPDWHKSIRRQLKDDNGGYGKNQNIAIFGEPGSGKFELVFSGRHLTIRCDGDSNEHVAFGGPIFYGHAAGDFREKPDHPGNVYWYQAKKANALFKMLDGKQRKQALVSQAPDESEVHFQGSKGDFSGIAISDLTSDQKAQVQKVLEVLVEPYRTSDRDEAMRCLKAQGGLDKCHIAFYQSDSRGESADIGDDGVWDIWRLEGPSFVWHYRGAPHVHVWVNVASNPSVKITAG